MVPSILKSASLFGVAMSAVGLLTSNPYEKAHKEAERVGTYLAYLIADY